MPERERFEARLRSEYPNVQHLTALSGEITSLYLFEWVDQLWRGWQARARLDEQV